MISLLKH